MWLLLFFKLTQQCFSTKERCFYHLVSCACWVCSYRWYKQVHCKFLYNIFRFILSVRWCFFKAAWQCNDMNNIIFKGFQDLSSEPYCSHSEIVFNFCYVEWYKWNCVGRVELTRNQTLFGSSNNSFIMVHLSILTCENIKLRGQFPRMFVFVLRIKEAGFKKSNKRLWKPCCPLSWIFFSFGGVWELFFIQIMLCIMSYGYDCIYTPFFLPPFLINDMAWHNWRLPEEFLKKLRLSVVVLSDAFKRSSAFAE